MLINNVSKQYHISTRTLRYYEEIGLLHPLRNPSGVRFYEPEQIKMLEEILLYRSLNISLKKIQALFKGDLDISHVIKDQLHATESSMRKLTYQKHNLESVMKTFGSMDNETHNLDAFLKEKIYLKEERWLQMTNKHLTIDIGEKLIPLTSDDLNPNLIRSIQILRENSEKDFDKIRLKDNLKDLSDYEFQILSDEDIICRSDLSTIDSNERINFIITQLKLHLLKQ